MQPQGGICPGCYQLLDADVPDPAPEVLAADLGVLESRIGEVRMGRTRMPLTGVLYATSRGLFFAPHDVERVVRVEGESVAGHSVLWWCASLIWSPLTLLLPFFHAPSMDKAIHLRISSSRALTACRHPL